MGVKEAYKRMYQSLPNPQPNPFDGVVEDTELDYEIGMAINRCMDILAQECPEVLEEEE